MPKQPRDEWSPCFLVQLLLGLELAEALLYVQHNRVKHVHVSPQAEPRLPQQPQKLRKPRAPTV